MYRLGHTPPPMISGSRFLKSEFTWQQTTQLTNLNHFCSNNTRFIFINKVQQGQRLHHHLKQGRKKRLKAASVFIWDMWKKTIETSKPWSPEKILYLGGNFFFQIFFSNIFFSKFFFLNFFFEKIKFLKKKFF